MPRVRLIACVGSAGGEIAKRFRDFGLDATDIACQPDDVGIADKILEVDPGKNAKIILGDSEFRQTVAKRPVFGAIKAEWGHLEDKTLMESVLQDSGAPRGESIIIPVEDLHVALRRSHYSNGFVCAGAGRSHSGSALRWGNSIDDIRKHKEFLRKRGEIVRLQPLLRGPSCAIHTLVSSEDVFPLRPVEQIVRSDAAHGTFEYLGISTLWSAPPETERSMEEVARAVGHWLRTKFMYRGVFGLDGIWTNGQFVATDLNPRYTFGAHVQANSAKFRYLRLLDRLLREYPNCHHNSIATIAGLIRTKRTPKLSLNIAGCASVPKYWSYAEGRWFPSVAGHVEVESGIRYGEALVRVTERGINELSSNPLSECLIGLAEALRAGC